MNGWKRIFGVDVVETAIWAVGSFLTTLMARQVEAPKVEVPR